MIDQSETNILESYVIYVLRIYSSLKTENWVWKNKGLIWVPLVNVVWRLLNGAVGNGSSKPCQCSPPPLTHPSRHPLPRSCLESCTLSLKSVNNQGQRKTMLWWVAAMCWLSACQAHIFEKHKQGQHGLQAKLRYNQGGIYTRQVVTMSVLW